MNYTKTKCILAILLFSFFYTTAQEKTIYYGSPKTGGAELHVSKDNSYKLIVNEGDYDVLQHQDREYLYLYNLHLNDLGFKVTEGFSKKKSKKITVHFYTSIIQGEEEDIYLGYKNAEDREYRYINLCYKKLLFNTKNVNLSERKLSFEIPRSSDIQLVSKEEKFYTEGFKLSPNANNVYIEYHGYGEDNFNDDEKLVLVEIYQTGKLNIREDLFSVTNAPAKHVKRIACDSITDWEIPEKLQKTTFDKFNKAEYIYEPISYYQQKPYVPEFKSINDAVAHLQKNDSKVLLLFNSLLNNEGEYYFQEIANTVNHYLKHDLLAEYLLDNYILYTLIPKDLKELKKYKLAITTGVVALNSSLETLYKENINTRDFQRKYDNMGHEISQNIVAINFLNSLKKKIDNQAVTAKDMLQLSEWRTNEFIIDILNKGTNNRIQDAQSAVEDIYDDNDYEEPVFNTTMEFFPPELSNKDIQQATLGLIQQHKTDKQIDLDYATLAYDIVYSFSERGRYGGYRPTKEIYELCFYLSRFNVETAKIQSEHTKLADDHMFEVYSILEKYGIKKSHFETVKPIFENFIKQDKYKYRALLQYFIHQYNTNTLSFETFDALFKEIIPAKGKYKEQFKAFDNQCTSCPFINVFELSMNQLCNSLAWDVATKHNTNKELLKNALEWSRLSIALSPESHYYLDTNAHLEYFLENQEKAIFLENKAIALAKESNHENLSEYKSTLEKIKEKTLK
ncbi:hypothetical protein GCM10022393_43100 [Aquimarina addita]|uniref:Uncharacterized protein n=1 Tax=Aquimarina addita TaxID=870485 RepID=A0ABP6UZC0_9FLAO